MSYDQKKSAKLFITVWDDLFNNDSTRYNLQYTTLINDHLTENIPYQYTSSKKLLKDISDPSSVRILWSIVEKVPGQLLSLSELRTKFGTALDNFMIYDKRSLMIKPLSNIYNQIYNHEYNYSKSSLFIFDKHDFADAQADREFVSVKNRVNCLYKDQPKTVTMYTYDAVLDELSTNINIGK